MGIWLRDSEIGGKVARLSWVTDSVSGFELSSLMSLAGIAASNLKLAMLVAGSDWFADGVDYDAPDYDAPYRSEKNAIGDLNDIAERSPELARVVSELPWIADDMTVYESSALQSIAGIAESDMMELAVRAAGSPWVMDGIVRHEMFALTNLKDMADWNPEFAWQIMGYSVDAPVWNRDAYLISALYFLRVGSAKQFERLISQPWFTDGLDPEERAFISTLRFPDPDWYKDLLETRFTQAATIFLPLAGEVSLWAFQHTPFPPDEDLLAMIEEGVRGAERFMAVPFPTNDVIVLLPGESKYLGGNAGLHLDEHIRLARFEGSPVTRALVYHELGHFYFTGTAPSWLIEGGADFIWAYTNDWLGLESIEDQLRTSAEYVRQSCVERGIENIHGALDTHDPSPSFGCSFGMGRHFLISLFETLGEEAMSAALRELYLRSEHDDIRLTEEDIYQAFLKHTPPGLEEEFRDLYRRLHGGPFTFLETEVSPTREEMASARLSEIIPWFENPPDSDHVSAVAALTYIWLRDADLGGTVARLPWLADSVDVMELLITRSLRSLVSDDIDIARIAVSVAWLADEVTLDEYLATQALTSLVDTDLQLAESTASLSWFSDDVTISEVQALKALTHISSADLELAKRLLSSPRFADDITRVESGVLHALGEIALHDPELALYWGGNAINGTGDLGLHVLRSIFDFVSLESDSWNRLTEQPWYADGLDDEETAFVTVLGRMATNHPQLYQELLQTHFTQASTVSLPLAGEVNIWVFQSTPFPPDDDVLTIIEDTVRISERSMAVPFPTTDIILLIGNHGVRSINHGSFMVLPRLDTGEVRFVPHETAHYYFGHSFRGPAWLLEGGAQFIEALVNDRTGVESLGDRRIGLRDGLQGNYRYCSDVLKIENIWHLNHFDGEDPWCKYHMGEYFLLNVYETIGQEAMMAALRDLSVILLKSDSKLLPSGFLSDNGWEKKIYHALLKRTPSDRQEEFRKLYLRLHGGPFAFPETEVSNEPDK